MFVSYLFYTWISYKHLKMFSTPVKEFVNSYLAFFVLLHLIYLKQKKTKL